MTEPSAPPPEPSYESKVARRREAKRLIDALTTVCVVVAVAIGTSQLVREGLQEFLNRPPGVGASPSEVAPGGSVAERPPPPEAAQIVPTPPSPSPQPIQRRPYPTQPSSASQRIHSGSEVRRDSGHARPYR